MPSVNETGRSHISGRRAFCREICWQTESALLRGRSERAICNCAWTRRTSLTVLFAGITRKLSARDFARSICKTGRKAALSRLGLASRDDAHGIA